MGLLDSVAYGIAGGLRGGAEAAQPALQQLQQSNLQQELNQQTSDLRVAAEKQISDYQLQQKHGEQSRVAGIIGQSQQVPALPDVNGVPQAGPPTAGETNTTASPTFNQQGAVEALNKAGMVNEAEALNKQGEYQVGGSAWGKQVLYNKNTGQYTVLDETGQRREATAEEIANMKQQAYAAGRQGSPESRAAALDKAMTSFQGAMEKSPPPTVWGKTDPIKQSFVPDPAVNEAYHTLASHLVGTEFDQGNMTPNVFKHITTARTLVNRFASQAELLAQQKGLQQGTPQWEDFTHRALLGKVQAAIGQQGQPSPSAPSAPGPNGTYSRAGGLTNGPAS